MLFTVNEVKVYTFEEFRQLQENRNLEESYTREDLNLVEKVIEHIKKNRVMYARLVFIIALALHYNSFAYASEFDYLDKEFGLIIDLIKIFAKWGCLGMGLKRLVEEMLAGANFKQASTAGVQYWLCYVFIQFYPKLFDMIKM